MTTDEQTIIPTRTVAEIEAELKAARDAEAERNQVADQELRLARKREELELTDGYMGQLQIAMTAQGVECSVRIGKLAEYGNMYFATLDYPEDSDGFKASASPRLERRGDSNYQIQFGGYRERKTYPRLKDGTFKYEKIASELAAYIRRSAEQRRVRRERQQAYEVSKTLESQLGTEFPDCTAYIRATEIADKVTIKFERVLSIEQAREVLIAIQKTLSH